MVRERRRYAVAIWKEGRRHWYGFHTPEAAAAFRAEHEPRYPGHVSDVIRLAPRR